MKEKKDVRTALVSLFSLDFGVRSISSFLKKEGYPAYIILFNKLRYSVEFLGNDYFSPSVITYDEYSKKNRDLLISYLVRLNPSLIGISVSSVTMQTAKFITEGIKDRFDVPVVWGGKHAIIAPEECIRYADMVCVGEGEFPMLELAEKIRKGEPFTGIDNLWIKKRATIEKNKMRGLIDDLDQLPFPDFLDKDNKYLIDSGSAGSFHHIISSYQRGIYPIMTSRGCIFNCSFCCNSIFRERYKGKGAYFRRRSVGNVIDELENAAQNRYFHTIRFWDDVFTLDEEWIEEFCFRYPQAVGKPFACYAHPNCTNKEILLKLRKVGLILVDVGIQSGSEAVSRGYFNRSQSNESFLDFARFMKQLGVTARYDLITDNPYEDDDDQRNTVELLSNLPQPYQIQLYSMCWFPETPLTKRALGEGIISHDRLEQYTSKALINFHMYLSLSRSKRDLYWNCIKAMAVNRFFPNALVRIAMRTVFFRKYPRFLFFIACQYLKLFEKLDIKRYGRKIVIRKRVPHNRSDTVTYYRQKRARNIFVTKGSQWLLSHPKREQVLFLSSSFDKTSQFCLQIRNFLKRGMVTRFIINLSFFYPENGDVSSQLSWSVKFPAGYKYETRAYFRFSGIDLLYSIEGRQYKAERIKNDNRACLPAGTYLVTLRRFHAPEIVINNLLIKI